MSAKPTHALFDRNVAVQTCLATYRLRPPYDVPHTSWVKCDLRDPDGARRALGSVETAILCAGQLSTSAVLRRDPTGSVLDTLRLVTNLLEAAAHLRVRRVIMIGSCTAYPPLARPAVETDILRDDPPALWFGVGWMHRYLETQLRWYVEQLDLIDSAVVLRPTLVYGPHDDFAAETGHFVPALIRKIVDRARPIDIWGDGSQTRNLLHAADLAAAILTALPRRTDRFETFNVVAPSEVSVNEVVRHLVEIDGFSDAIVTHELERSGGPSTLSVSGAAFAAATGWEVKFGVREGLADTLGWYRRTIA